ncbi:MAG: RIP metalloprotease RseP [Chloroflexi bacterium 13_1_40CM_4_68_4]|nr:MAG: RIP metalloprotease RseP [Chloroflexi bacterium 13_1_40CM_4_68_4]
MDVRTVLLFLLLLTVLVFVHELGHFITARLVGMRVLEFGFGFPPRLISIRRPATYEVIDGELTLTRDGSSLTLHAGDRVRVSGSRSDAITISAAGGTLRLGPGDRYAAKGAAMFRPSWARGRDDADFRLSDSDLGLANEGLFPLQPGVDLSINWIPFGGFVRILGEDGTAKLPDGRLAPDSFAAKPIPARILVLVAGVGMNVLLALAVYTLIFATGEPTFNGKVRWLHVEPGSPAAVAGLQDGDSIAKIDGKTFTEPQQMRDYIYSSQGKEITLTVERNGQTFDVKATPRANPPADQGPLGLRDAVPVNELVSYPLPQAFARAAERTGVVITEIVRAFSSTIAGLITGGGGGDQVSGPVGILNLTSQVSQLGSAYVLELLALLSLNLAVLNIVPFPGLDGGRLLFVVIEGLRGGRRLDPRTEAAIHALGFVFLLFLVGVVSFFDIRRLSGG